MVNIVKCENIIDNIVSKGGEILYNKTEGQDSLNANIICLKYNNCQLKMSFLNLGSKQIVVSKSCCCGISNTWKQIPNGCVDKFNL